MTRTTSKVDLTGRGQGAIRSASLMGGMVPGDEAAHISQANVVHSTEAGLTLESFIAAR